MRIIAGTGRGRKLAAPPGITTRPTSDRVKEALYSIIGSRIGFSGIRVLDLCAGSGALGIEALSRGARFCCFVENNRSAAAVIEKNLAVAGFCDRSERLVMDAMAALPLLADQRQCFDLLLFDPPYESDLYQRIFKLLDASSLLASGALLVAECSAQNQLRESYGCLQRVDRRVYGDTAIELFIQEEK